MMKGMGALVLAVATILVCCRADSRQDPDSVSHNSREKFEGHKAGGGSFVRQTRDTRPPSYLPYLLAQYDYSPYGGKRDLWTLSPTELRSGYYALGLPKRNFDEIDRSGLDNFVKKRNFDEIDLSAMPFPISKREPRPQNFDEIDLSSMPFPYKRGPHLRNFDEIDLSSMPFPYSKRSAHLLLPRIMAAESSFISKLPRFTEDQIPHGIKRARHNVKTYVGEGDFDEIDASMFPIGNS